MNIIGIIPSRMKSSRLPDKAMKKIHNIPMIGHVYFRSKLLKILNEVYVATCDNKIKNYIRSINGKAVMTSKNHERAVDRTEEALKKIEKITRKKIDLIVMIQGDEPLLEPQMINQVVNVFKKNKNIKISNLYTRLNNSEEIKDPNRVKVVLDDNNNAIYITKKISLTQVATAIHVIFDAVKMSEGDINVLYKTLRVDAAEAFDDIDWIAFTNPTVPISKTRFDFKEYKYLVGKDALGIGTDLTEFIAFAIKIVLQGSNSSVPPVVKEFRTIAFQA